MALSTDRRRYNRTGPELKPKFIGYYSEREDGEFFEDISRLRYVKKTLGEVNWDLKQSHESAKVSSDNTQQNAYFRYLQCHQEHVESSSDVIRSPIVTGRSALMNIGEMPYANHNESAFCAHLLKGVIYLYKPEKNVADEVAYPYGVWSKKFQKYLTSGRANGVPDPEERVLESEEFIGMYRLNLKNHTIIYNGKIDGVQLNETESETDLYGRLGRDEIIADINRRGFVSMKTSLRPKYHNAFRRHKSRHFWISGALGMAFDRIVGFRNDEGFVYKNEMYDLEEFEEIGSGLWNKNVMINFIGDFMSHIKTCLASALRDEDINTAEKILYFVKKPNMPLVPTGKLDHYRYDWIPEWYMETVRQNIQKK